jgi:hypothetical protein
MNFNSFYHCCLRESIVDPSLPFQSIRSVSVTAGASSAIGVAAESLTVVSEFCILLI